MVNRNDPTVATRARRRSILSGLVALALAAVPLSAGAVSGGDGAVVASSEPLDLSPMDCEGPVPDPAPGTDEFRERDRLNMYCSQERKVDRAAHPNRGSRLNYRSPDRFDGVRWRYDTATANGVAVEVFRPCTAESCAMPDELAPVAGPYPAVIMIHGFSASASSHWWSAQTLAEAGYLVVNLATTVSTSSAQGLSVLNWVLDPSNPYAADIDRDRVGAAGHSQGGGVVASFQGNAGVSAIIAWDGGTTVGSAANTPTMYQMADYTTWPGYPVPSSSVPNTVRAAGFQTLRERGVDSMVVTGRATTHLDWVGDSIGNRYAESMWVYYNLAWFDRYLKGKLVLPADDAERARRQRIAEDAFDRLTAAHFDASADRHNISQGFWDPERAVTSGDPVFGGNVPYAIEGKAIADRLSYNYRSVCFISLPDHRSSEGAIAARAQTAPDGTMRKGGCPAPVPTEVVYTGETRARGETIHAAAALVDRDGRPVAGRPLRFGASGVEATAMTGSDGRATATLTVPDHGRTQLLTVTFDGDDGHRRSSTTATIRWGAAP